MRMSLIPLCLVALAWPQQIAIDGDAASKHSTGTRIERKLAAASPFVALTPLKYVKKTAHAPTEAAHAIADKTALKAETLFEVPIQDVCATLAAAADASGLPAPFFLRLIWQESRFKQRVVSPAGALGVAQFMPEVAAERGLERPFDPQAALWASAFFLREHYRTFGNLGLAAMAYNAGAKRVQDWLARRGKLPDETRKYVTIITGYEPEQWIEPRLIALALKLPRRAPCGEAAGLSQGVSVSLVDVRLEEPIRKIVETAKAEAEAKAAKAEAARKAKLAKAAAKAAAKTAAKAVQNKKKKQARAKVAKDNKKIDKKVDKKADKKTKSAADAKRDVKTSNANARQKPRAHLAAN